MSKSKFSSIPSILKDAKKGKMFILVDDKDRENEGDLVIPGSKCNSKIINFMAKHGRGLICLALTKKQIDNLKLPLMSQINRSRMQTAFTVSIEAKRGISTGISAFDRAKTIKVAINPNSKKKDIVSPGHVFPLVSRNGGVLESETLCVQNIIDLSVRSFVSKRKIGSMLILVWKYMIVLRDELF